MGSSSSSLMVAWPPREMNFRAFQPEHHHIGEHQVGALLSGRFERSLSVGGRLNLVVIREQPFNVLAHISVVIG